jgi:hypothetical protein
MLRTSVLTVLPTHQGKTAGSLSLGVLFAYARVLLCCCILPGMDLSQACRLTVAAASLLFDHVLNGLLGAQNQDFCKLVNLCTPLGLA